MNLKGMEIEATTEGFCEWYNALNDTDIEPDTIQYELSYYEFDMLWDQYEDVLNGEL